MWFGSKPKQSRAAPISRQLSEAEQRRLTQRELQKEIQAFIKQDKQKNELLADRIQDLVNFQKDQLLHQQQQEDEQQHHQQTKSTSMTSFLPPIFTPSSSTSNLFPIPSPPPSNTNSKQQQQQHLSLPALTPAQTLQRSPLDRRIASLVTVDILNTCSNLVKGIDNILEKNKENKTKSTVKIGASATLSSTTAATTSTSSNSKNHNKEINLFASINATNHSHALKLMMNGNDDDDLDDQLMMMMEHHGAHHSKNSDGNVSTFRLKPSGATNNRIQGMTRQHRGVVAMNSSNPNQNTNGTNKSGKNTDHVSSVLDQEELEEELKRMRKICQEDCFLDDDACSVVDGYSTDPFPAQLASTTSVVQSVAEIVDDSEKIFAGAREMMTCLEECNSLRKDMILMRRFKRNCMRANFHSRKVLSWANQCRTHMFIFNNTINQIGRDAAEDLRKGKDRKLDQQHRTAELIIKLRETESELAELKKEVEGLTVVHGDLEQKLLDNYKMRMEEKKYSSDQSLAGTFNSSSVGSPLLMLGSSWTRPKSPFDASTTNAPETGIENNNNNNGSVSPLPTRNNNNNLLGASVVSVGGGLFGSPSSMVKKPSFHTSNTNNIINPNSSNSNNVPQTSAAHRAFEKMSVSSVELYLLLHRYILMAMTPSSTNINGEEKNAALSEKVLTAIKRVMMTIEQSVDVEKINLFGNASELYHI